MQQGRRYAVCVNAPLVYFLIGDKQSLMFVACCSCMVKWRGMKFRTSIVCDLFGFAEVSTHERIHYCVTNSLVESMRVIATSNLVNLSVIVNMRVKPVGS